MDHNQERRRGHFHRSRRGPDRRGTERRTPPPQGGQDQIGRDQVDVEQIMRDIRARIAQRHGIDLSNQQIEELAARRLEAILDPRSIKPGLLDELRRSAGAPPPQPDPAEAVDLSYSFEDTTLYESSRGLLRGIRRVLNPILKLFFNPNPLIRALNIQARWNSESGRRQAERDRRQTEWNGLHYELLRRMVTEVSRVSLEMQSLTSQIESLSAKVDFNERRVRGIEATTHQTRPAPRSPEPMSVPAASAIEAPLTEATPEGQPSESTRRRRRRRRGRRGSGAPNDTTPGSPNQQAAADAGSDSGPDPGDDLSADEGTDEQPALAFSSPLPETAHRAAPTPEPEPASAPAADLPAHVENHTADPEPQAPAPEQREPGE